MNPEDAIIAEIDAMIDDQLAAGEPMNGFDYDDPDYPICPHEGCWRDWHGEKMGRCPGSPVLGPLLSASSWWSPEPLPGLPSGELRAFVESFAGNNYRYDGGPAVAATDASGAMALASTNWSMPDADPLFDISQWAAIARGFDPPRRPRVTLWDVNWNLVGPVVPPEVQWPPRDLVSLMNRYNEQATTYLDALGVAFRGLSQTIEDNVLPAVREACKSLEHIAATLAPVLDIENPFADTPVDDRPALPRPSTTPPMWAVDPGRTRRRRNQ